ncbi:MAG: dephospho-CoA kinase [Candidatus Thiodiazotropha lotti]|uniref:Dephospho-CoA kinase n=1 Tax=Candidatus Thiodiazotropha lotti TaxID=2792787 RepID=A0A9E4K5R4_9GAMM|nr:dephospho-CoA kinase [Candidatus Thiodiazotropha lotti]MCW4203785.1 dephospho-CoA kinase [Candidatus Thiodiazotropha lotti]ODC00291.1 dephospho-CoA kinase [Candidatus Thiodiazotropha endoloripes]
MLVVALTGGIGCGKSAVSTHLESLGVPIIDADHLAHQLVQPGTPALVDIQNVFGGSVIDNRGCLNRTALRNIVFDKPQQREQLESILHPRIKAAMEAWLKSQTAEYVVLVIPLLFETGQQTLADRILLVDCYESIQIDRVLQRDKLSRKQIQQIIASQANRQTRLQGANDIIENNSTYANLIKATNDIHEKYLKLAIENRKPTS